MHVRNPEIIKLAEVMGRTPSSLAMKLTNFASLDPTITSTGRSGKRSEDAVLALEKHGLPWRQVQGSLFERFQSDRLEGGFGWRGLDGRSPDGCHC